MPFLDPHVHPYPTIHPFIIILHDFYTKTFDLVWCVNWSGLNDLSYNIIIKIHMTTLNAVQ